jgi:heterotetrameric sarcosine oxidase gamma subunit
MARKAGGKSFLTALQQAGVESRALRTATLSIEEVRSASMVRLHSLPDQPFSSTFPFDLPSGTGACSGENPAVLCLRPGEWLLISDSISAQDLMQQIETHIDPGQTSCLDNSDGLAVFRLAGAGAPWLLGKLSCLDFLAGINHGRHCACTKMGQVAVIVYYHQPHDEISRDQFVFDLVFDRSVAKYLWSLLTESAGHADELAKKYGDAR